MESKQTDNKTNSIIINLDTDENKFKKIDEVHNVISQIIKASTSGYDPNNTKSIINNINNNIMFNVRIYLTDNTENKQPQVIMSYTLLIPECRKNTYKKCEHKLDTLINQKKIVPELKNILIKMIDLKLDITPEYIKTVLYILDL